MPPQTQGPTPLPTTPNLSPLASRLKQVLDQLAPAFQSFQQMGQRGPQQGGSPPIAGQMPNITNPLNPPPMSPMEARAQHERGVVPSAEPPMTSPQSPIRGPSIAGLGMSYPTKAAANLATGTAIMSDLTNFANMMEQRDRQRKESEAEYYLRELTAAHNDKDWERFNTILADPKVKKILKEIKGYVPFEEPTEKPPAVSAAEKIISQGGNKQAIQQAQAQTGGGGQPPAVGQPPPQAGTPTQTGQIPYQPSAEAQAVAAQGESQKITSQYQQQLLTQDPLYRFEAATGSPVSSAEKRGALYQELGWLGASAEKFQQMDYGTQLAYYKMMERMYEVDQHYQTWLKGESLTAGARVKAAEITAGPRYEAVKALNEINKMKIEMLGGKSTLDKLKAEQTGYKTLIDNATKTINSNAAGSDEKEAARKTLEIAQKQLGGVNADIQKFVDADYVKSLGLIVEGVPESGGETSEPPRLPAEPAEQ